MLGSPVAEQIDTAVATESVNVANQITSRTGGGIVRVGGFISETGTVTIAGSPARMLTTTNFTGEVSASVGTNWFDVVATDLSGNVTTNWYQVPIIANGLDTVLTYDAAGNTLSKSNVAGVMTFGWDGADRCTAISNGNFRTTLAYDGNSRWARITEYSNSVVTADRRFVWNGVTLAEERDANNNVVQRFFSDGFQRGGTNYFYVKDQIGSVREVYSQSGVLQARFDYDPYGNKTQTYGTLNVDFGFAGLFELKNGLKLAVWRLYDPQTARWLSKDPIKEDGGLNLYAYCGGDPVNWSDSEGNQPQINAFAKGSVVYDSANNLTAKPGYFLVTAHGISDAKGRHARKISPAQSVGDRHRKIYSPKELAALIAPRFQDGDHTIVLLACNAAKPNGNNPSFAEQLLSEIKTLLPGRAIKVAAPLGPVNYGFFFVLPASGATGLNGVYVAGPRGEFNSTTPGGNPLKVFQ